MVQVCFPQAGQVVPVCLRRAMPEVSVCSLQVAAEGPGGSMGAEPGVQVEEGPGGLVLEPQAPGWS